MYRIQKTRHRSAPHLLDEGTLHGLGIFHAQIFVIYVIKFDRRPKKLIVKKIIVVTARGYPHASKKFSDEI